MTKSLNLHPNAPSNAPHHPPNFVLQPNTAYCRICGEINQDPHAYVRWVWSYTHSYTHTPAQHRSLELSHRHLTPEAAQKLQHITIPIIDLVMDDEVASALREAPRPNAVL